MFELYHHNGLTASEITTLIDIDKGYLSRILKKFEKNKLISKDGSKDDKRAVSLILTAKGKKEFETLNKTSDKQIEDVFKTLSEKDTVDLLQKMREIQQLIEK
jgi:DNA-binding MarR family transcriptional regulator